MKLSQGSAICTLEQVILEGVNFGEFGIFLLFAEIKSAIFIHYVYTCPNYTTQQIDTFFIHSQII